jgi:siroheme synthase
MDLARSDARLHLCRQGSLQTHIAAGSINQLLVDLAREGCRLFASKVATPSSSDAAAKNSKHWLPLAFPSKSSPALPLRPAALPIPGFPLTHRDHAQAVTFVTGHLKDGTVNLDWPALARPCHTVVFYMGIGAAAEICRQMINHGLPSMTPAAVVRNGTLPDQQTLLATWAHCPAHQRIRHQTTGLIVVGSVVSLHEKLSWFEKS